MLDPYFGAFQVPNDKLSPTKHVLPRGKVPWDQAISLPMASGPWKTRRGEPGVFRYFLNFWRGLVWFYGISTIVDYSMPNPVYTYMLDLYDLSKYCYVSLSNSIKHQSFVCTQLNVQTVLFQTTQFSIHQQN